MKKYDLVEVVKVVETHPLDKILKKYVGKIAMVFDNHKSDSEYEICFLDEETQREFLEEFPESAYWREEELEVIEWV